MTDLARVLRIYPGNLNTSLSIAGVYSQICGHVYRCRSKNLTDVEFNVSQSLRKLQSEGMSSQDELRLLAMSKCLLKLHKAKGEDSVCGSIVDHRREIDK